MTFSRVISRPKTTSINEKTDLTAHAKPTLSTSRGGQGIWEVGTTQMPPTFYKDKASVGGDFYTDTLFNPTWGEPWWLRCQEVRHGHGLAHPLGVEPYAARNVSQSPPQLTHDDDLTESSLSRSLSSTSEAISPPQTACSITAVLGSAGIHKKYTFEDDYDRPEASPNFIRKFMRRSKSSRRQARIRDGDFRTSDEEDDYHVEEEQTVVVRTEEPLRPTPLFNDVSIVFLARATTTPSRLSRRVSPPPPINTAAIQVAMTKSVIDDGCEYEVEVGDVDGTPLSGSEAGFDADDEDEGESPTAFLAKETAEVTLAGCLSGGFTKKSGGTAIHTRPSKKTYAAVVAAPSPSPSVVPRQAIQKRRSYFECKEGCLLDVSGWQPFVEPLDY